VNAQLHKYSPLRADGLQSVYLAEVGRPFAERLEHLVASHTKPWRDSTNEERLNGENGLLLTPTVDHLFDKGSISFEDKGDLIVSPVADRASLVRMGIRPEARVNVAVFSEGQRVFLEYHRENVLRMSHRRR
jgi:predicted restriction endonuclease